MNENQAISPLQGVASVLVYLLNLILRDTPLGWDPVRGFQLEVNEGKKDNEFFLKIVPDIWPNGSFVSLSIFKVEGEEEYGCIRPVIHAPHLIVPDSQVPFQVSFTIDLGLVPARFHDVVGSGAVLFIDLAEDAGFTVSK